MTSAHAKRMEQLLFRTHLDLPLDSPLFALKRRIQNEMGLQPASAFEARMYVSQFTPATEFAYRVVQDMSRLNKLDLPLISNEALQLLDTHLDNWAQKFDLHQYHSLPTLLAIEYALRRQTATLHENNWWDKALDYAKDYTHPDLAFAAQEAGTPLENVIKYPVYELDVFRYVRWLSDYLPPRKKLKGCPTLQLYQYHPNAQEQDVPSHHSIRFVINQQSFLEVSLFDADTEESILQRFCTSLSYKLPRGFCRLDKIEYPPRSSFHSQTLNGVTFVAEDKEYKFHPYEQTTWYVSTLYVVFERFNKIRMMIEEQPQREGELLDHFANAFDADALTRHPELASSLDIIRHFGADIDPVVFVYCWYFYLYFTDNINNDDNNRGHGISTDDLYPIIDEGHIQSLFEEVWQTPESRQLQFDPYRVYESSAHELAVMYGESIYNEKLHESLKMMMLYSFPLLQHADLARYFGIIQSEYTQFEQDKHYAKQMQWMYTQFTNTALQTDDAAKLSTLRQIDYVLQGSFDVPRIDVYQLFNKLHINHQVPIAKAGPFLKVLNNLKVPAEWLSSERTATMSSADAEDEDEDLFQEPSTTATATDLSKYADLLTFFVKIEDTDASTEDTPTSKVRVQQYCKVEIWESAVKETLTTLQLRIEVNVDTSEHMVFAKVSRILRGICVPQTYPDDLVVKYQRSFHTGLCVLTHFALNPFRFKDAVMNTFLSSSLTPIEHRYVHSTQYNVKCYLHLSPQAERVEVTLKLRNPTDTSDVAIKLLNVPPTSEVWVVKIKVPRRVIITSVQQKQFIRRLEQALRLMQTEGIHNDYNSWYWCNFGSEVVPNTDKHTIFPVQTAIDEKKIVVAPELYANSARLIKKRPTAQLIDPNDEGMVLYMQLYELKQLFFQFPSVLSLSIPQTEPLDVTASDYEDMYSKLVEVCKHALQDIVRIQHHIQDAVRDMRSTQDQERVKKLQTMVERLPDLTREQQQVESLSQSIDFPSILDGQRIAEQIKSLPKLLSRIKHTYVNVWQESVKHRFVQLESSPVVSADNDLLTLLHSLRKFCVALVNDTLNDYKEGNPITRESFKSLVNEVNKFGYKLNIPSDYIVFPPRGAAERSPHQYVMQCLFSDAKQIGLARNTLLDNRRLLPYLPNCVSTVKNKLVREGYDEGMRLDDLLLLDNRTEEKSEIIIATNKAVYNHRMGVLPERILHLLQIVDDNAFSGHYAYFRVGVQREFDAYYRTHRLLYVLQEALEKQRPDQMHKFSVAKMKAALREKALSGMLQSTGYTINELVRVLDQNEFIDPLVWLEALEVIMRCRLFIFTQDLDTNPKGTLACPSYYRVRLTQPRLAEADQKNLVMLYAHRGQEFDDLNFPTIELIGACRASDVSTDVNRVHAQLQFFRTSAKLVNHLDDLLKELYFTIVPDASLLALPGMVPVSQTYDVYGKTRSVVWSLKGVQGFESEYVSVFCDPMVNVSSTFVIPSDESVMYKLPLHEAERWFALFPSAEPTQQVVFKQRVVGLYRNRQFVPVEGLPRIDVTKPVYASERFAFPVPLTSKSITSEYRKLTRQAHVLSSYVLWCYSQCPRPESADTLKLFLYSRLVIDTSRTYDDEYLTRLLSLDNEELVKRDEYPYVIIRHDQPQEAQLVQQKLIYLLRQHHKYRLEFLLDYKYRQFVPDYYTTAEDFDGGIQFTVYNDAKEYSLVNKSFPADYRILTHLPSVRKDSEDATSSLTSFVWVWKSALNAQGIEEVNQAMYMAVRRDTFFDALAVAYFYPKHHNIHMTAERLSLVYQQLLPQLGYEEYNEELRLLRRTETTSGQTYVPMVARHHHTDEWYALILPDWHLHTLA